MVKPQLVVFRHFQTRQCLRSQSSMSTTWLFCVLCAHLLDIGGSACKADHYGTLAACGTKRTACKCQCHAGRSPATPTSTLHKGLEAHLSLEVLLGCEGLVVVLVFGALVAILVLAAQRDSRKEELATEAVVPHLEATEAVVPNNAPLLQGWGSLCCLPPQLLQACTVVAAEGRQAYKGLTTHPTWMSCSIC